MKNNIIILLVFISIFFSKSLEASVFLYNDSAFTLKAVVVAANGTKMGEKELKPEQTGYVEDFIGQSDPVGQVQTPEGNSSVSVTPYTVFWYCESGGLYATCTNIGTGALAAPNTCSGPMFCQPPANQQSNTQNSGSE